ncbi:hypothetical protein UFOVP225_120 [uncultured Caudovirales phage]|uniref:Uncharacterized protein n=1 Tax=uncultured Caudovirales phage TaxID=2100421 RepID=A0A6J5L373_9CAUD|nr:hypothetical protein UFOVP113_133 [uncultured Caudovirales phage]CAB5219733.1 hypothetical protein UFOVP225_120 [uncultured Caudovirales phage]
MPIITNESGPDLDPIRREVQQYVTLKDEADAITERVNTIKKRLTGYIEDLGEPNEKGSIVLTVDDDRTGTRSIVKQRRVSKQFDEDKANAILQSKGVFETCTKTITVLDQDAVMAAYYEGKLTDEDIDTMFPEKVTWAIVLEKK